MCLDYSLQCWCEWRIECSPPGNRWMYVFHLKAWGWLLAPRWSMLRPENLLDLQRLILELSNHTIHRLLVALADVIWMKGRILNTLQWKIVHKNIFNSDSIIRSQKIIGWFIVPAPSPFDLLYPLTFFFIVLFVYGLASQRVQCILLEEIL